MNASAIPGGRFSNLWGSSAGRLILIYGAFFLAWSLMLVGLISWQTSRYLNNRVSNTLTQRAQALAALPRSALPDGLDLAAALDQRSIGYYGLFDGSGRHLSGDIRRIPPELPVDGSVHELSNGVQSGDTRNTLRTSGIAMRLNDGATLVLARDYAVVAQVRELIRGYFFWALLIIAIPSLLGGYLLSRGPIQRVRRMEAAIEPIMRGDLRTRLPVSSSRDELDMLAVIVNRMLDQLERLLSEVKGVSDNIAHDLRTPLTRLRAQLYRLQREGHGDEHGQLLERCLNDTDSLLDRFRALLRISELEDLQRRAGFRRVDVLDILHRVHELYAPLAEDRAIRFTLRAETLPALTADAELLFEALTNLISNGIKFTAAGGHVGLSARVLAEELCIEVFDTGSGIPESEREAVLGRFYRTQSGARWPGFGLGLSIVAAIVKLHGYRLVIGDHAPRGTLMSIYCPLDPRSAAIVTPQ
ncbi:MAG: HAMP domain-containing sensor histidine kinase [Steroidobacteraceae bacterium]